MTNSTIWVGPSKCDSDRESRTRTEEQIWKEIAKISGLGSAHAILGGAVDLFREALSCFQNGAFMASNLMCRSVSETAVYLAISRKSPRPPSTIDVDLTQIRKNWSKIRDKAKEMSVVRDRDLLALVEIRKRGNFVAHYGQIFDQRIFSTIDSRNRGLRLWADRQEAEDSLRKTADILSYIIGRIF